MAEVEVLDGRGPRDIQLERLNITPGSTTCSAPSRILRAAPSWIGWPVGPPASPTLPRRSTCRLRRLQACADARAGRPGPAPRQGREHTLTLDARPLRRVVQWTSRYERFWTERLDRLEHSSSRKGIEMKTFDITVSRAIRGSATDVFDVWLDPKSPGGLWYGVEKRHPQSDRRRPLLSRREARGAVVGALRPVYPPRPRTR